MLLLSMTQAIKKYYCKPIIFLARRYEIVTNNDFKQRFSFIQKGWVFLLNWSFTLNLHQSLLNTNKTLSYLKVNTFISVHRTICAETFCFHATLKKIKYIHLPNRQTTQIQNTNAKQYAKYYQTYAFVAYKMQCIVQIFYLFSKIKNLN